MDKAHPSEGTHNLADLNIPLRLGVDMRPYCEVPKCHPEGVVDAAKASFDLFRFCFALTLVRFCCQGKDEAEGALWENTLFMLDQAHLRPLPCLRSDHGHRENTIGEEREEYEVGGVGGNNRSGYTKSVLVK